MSPNLFAFLSMIRTAEGTAGPSGYKTLFGGGLFHSYLDHPRQRVTKKLGKKVITSSAAGAYQFLEDTWDECAAALKLPDFSPESQDKAARFLIRRRGALADVIAGRFRTAIGKCSKEWASMPGSPYGQPTITMAYALELIAKAGGVNTEGV